MAQAGAGEAADVADDGYPRGRDRALALAAPMVCMALAALDQSVMGPALPMMAREFGGLGQISWVVSAYMLGATVSMPLYGRVSDLYGRRLLLSVAISIFAAASIGCGASDSLAALVLFRLLQGVGAGGLVSLSQTSVADALPPAERFRYQGLFVSVFAGCSLAGPFVGGFLTDATSWRWIFYVNAPLAILSLAMVGRSAKSRAKPAAQGLDIISILALAGASSAVLLALLGGGGGRWLSFAWGVATALVLVLIWRERRSRTPLFPARVFANAIALGSVGGTFLTACFMFALGAYLPAYLQLAFHLGAAQSGLAMLPLPVALAVASIVGGRLFSPAFRTQLLPKLGLGIAGLGGAALGFCARGGASLPTVEALLLLIGLSLGVVGPGLLVRLQNQTASQDLGVATSTLTFCRSLGGMVGAALAGVVLSRSLGVVPVAPDLSGLTALDMIAYRSAFSVVFVSMAAIAALGTAVLSWPPARRERTE
jgi:MFS family permease